MKKTVFNCAVILSVLCALSLSEASAPDKLIIAYPAVSGLFGPMYVAVDGNYFRQNGIDVRLVYIGPAPKTAQVLVAGDVEIGLQSPGTSLSANLSGADLVFIAGLDRKSSLALVVQPEIKKVIDLKGKTVGIPAIGASPDYALGFILKKHGLKPGEDVKITQTGGMPNSVAALEKKLVAAAMLSFPSRLLARKMGMVELVDLVEEDWIYPASTLTVRREFLISQPDLLKRTVKSYLEGIHRYYSDRDFAVRVVARHTRTQDIRVVEVTYDALKKALVGPKPYVPREGIAVTLQTLAAKRPEISRIDPHRYIRDEYVKQFDESGFIDSLYRKR